MDLGCTVQSWVYLEWGCSVQSWGVPCEVGIFCAGLGCIVQNQGALGTVGEALGKPPLALGQEHSCRDKQDMGLRLSGDNGQERKYVPDPFMDVESVWGLFQHSFQQNKVSRSQASRVGTMWDSREQAGERGPRHTDGVCAQGLALRG